MRTNLVVKMTIITFIFFMLFLMVAFFFEGTFFESFYLQQKVDILSKQVREFSAEYNHSNWDNQELKDNIQLFNNVNGVELTVLDTYGNITHEPLYELIVEDSNGRIYKAHLNHALNENSYGIFSLEIGDVIDLYGYTWTSSDIVFKPMRIAHDNIEIIDVIEDVENLEHIQGTVLGLTLPTYDEIKSAFYKQPIREIILNFMIEHGKEYAWLYKAGVYENTNVNELLNQLIFYRPLGTPDSRRLVLALGSQRHIVEAKGILEDYQVYILLFSFVLIVFLSYFYSMTLMNPILKINKAAEKMARLDFSETITIKRNDELGSLSQSLNILSTNLSSNMEKLKDANKQLTIEIEKERKLENMRKEFVSGVSHELKTPLGIIRGFAEGVRDDVFEDSAYYLDVIIDETEKMDALVVDMLELSKLETENFKINPTYFDLYNLIEFVKKKFEYSLLEKNLSVELRKNTRLSICFADEFRIEQVLVNFMSNAIRHSKRNETIYIDVDRIGEELLFQIENVGDPIPEDKLSKVWNRFYRVEASRNKSDGGTGLGLAIVRNILELHHGKFGAENTKTGVKFYFKLNAKEVL